MKQRKRLEWEEGEMMMRRRRRDDEESVGLRNKRGLKRKEKNKS